MSKTIVIVNPTISPNFGTPMVQIPYLYLTLKSFYKENSVHADQWNWPLPITEYERYSFDELVDQIVMHSPDVVGFSSYLWNFKLNLDLGRAVKLKLPNTLLIYGGPEVLYEKQNDWFREKSWVDLVATSEGPGEAFIHQLLDQLTMGQFEPEKIPYCVYPSSDRSQWLTSKIKLHRNAFQWPTSMFNGSEAEMQVLKLQTAQENKRLYTIWETTRGCPYGCSYCDWGGGIETKVIAKSPETISAELDKMEALDIGYIEFCDSNFGIMKDRDVSIVQQLVDRSKQGWNIQVDFDGKAKNHFQYTEQIDHLLLSSKVQFHYDYHISVSASNDQIAKAVNRSTFQIHKQIEFASKVRDYGYNLRIELILGLPGATIDSFYDEYNILATTEAWLSERFVLLLLGRSPIAQKSFIEKHKIKSAFVKHANYSVFSEGTAEKYSVLKDPKYLGKYEIVVETDTYTRDEWVQMYFMDKFANSLECCNFLTPLRLEAAKNGYSAAQFYRACWEILNGMQGFAAKEFDSIISGIEEAIDTGGDIAMYRYKDRAATLQIISVSFFLEFYFEFLLAFKNHFPEIESLDQTINDITMRILTANDENDPLVKAQWFYQEFENRFL